ncbi:MAG: leucine-rich repeat protein, partial [Oscillospiraceae bacterium]|nr:leucine-rich repeat protein [Oscillospiraceae bacterium]
AQTYAEKYNREFIALDENPDTTVNKYLKYEIHEDYVEITRCDTSAEGEIMIPATIQGLPVTSIGMGAFEYCSSLETVIIPESVVTISEEAFWRCSALKAVTISENVVNIELNAFFGCSALESITIQNPDCEIDDDKNTLSDTVVIYGYPGSTAQAYAEKYNREFIALDENPVNSEILWGDANCDNSVDIADVVLMNRVYVGVDQVSTQGLLNADVDQSGKIELADSMNVLKLLVHLLEPDNFPIS